MAGAIEQVEREITVLKQAVAAIAQETRDLYVSYLSTLGQVAPQQLIAASYHLCTQVYPEAFLQLSWEQRQEFQQALQELGQQAEQRLQDCLQLLSVLDSDPDDPAQLIQVFEQLEQGIVEELQAVSHAANQLLQSWDVLSSPAVELILEVAAKAEASGGTTATGPPNLITALIEAEDAERSSSSSMLDSIAEIPTDKSLDWPPSPTRELLPPGRAKSRTMADELESAAEDEIEAALEGHRSELPSTAIVAIYLRLGEIEFADSTVMAWRNQIRKIAARLTGLQREFAKKQRERTIAEAESAWRAGWFNHQAKS